MFRYNGTLGHKVNHSFKPNSEFALYPLHPVLGTIMSVVAIQDIPPNQEVFSTFLHSLHIFIYTWDNYIIESSMKIIQSRLLLKYIQC